jgi:hypothetical protein
MGEFGSRSILRLDSLLTRRELYAPGFPYKPISVAFSPSDQLILGWKNINPTFWLIKNQCSSVSICG